MDTLRGWGLRQKILCGFGIVLLLIVLVFGWAVHNLLQLGRAADAAGPRADDATVPAWMHSLMESYF